MYKRVIVDARVSPSATYQTKCLLRVDHVERQMKYNASTAASKQYNALMYIAHVYIQYERSAT